MSNIDQDFVEFIVKSLVGHPDNVKIERRIDEKGVLIELTVDPEDLGRIIGKRGATAQSLRTLLRALGTKNDARYNLKIIDNGPEDYVKPERTERPNQDNNQSGYQNNEVSEEQSESVEPQANSTDTVRDEISVDDDDENQQESDMASKTRKELEDLDDLDI